LAFDLITQGLTEERDARLALRDRITENELLKRIVNDVKTLLTPEGTDPDETDTETNHLWDEHLGTVPGGTDWSGQRDEETPEELMTPTMDAEHLTVRGPEFDTPET